MDTFVEREIIVALSLASACLFAWRRRWESVLTRVVLAGVYVCILYGVVADGAMFLTRWAWILILGVEVLFNAYVAAKGYKK
jgi:hypothetical protein